MTPYLFPLNFALNSFSLSALVVAAGLFGLHHMAADLALAQAAMIALFYSFSGNARNLILKSNDNSMSASIEQMRVIIAPVLAIAALVVSIHLSKVGLWLSLGIVLRQLSEWFSELELARLEKDLNYGRAYSFFLAYSLPLAALICAMLFVQSMFLPALYVWAVAPLLLCARGGVRILRAFAKVPIDWHKLIPNYASTVIIGTVVFFFRLLIAGFAGKEAAGQLFAAFTLGSLVGAVYDRTIGPSFMVSGELNTARAAFFRFAWILPVLGAGVIASAYFLGDSSPYVVKNIYLVGAAGFSIAGGFVMCGAQAIKINILHSSSRNDVFIADLLSNFAILISVPVFFLFFGEVSLILLFFTNALLVYAGYWLISGSPVLAYTPLREKILHYTSAFAVVMPLFFQLGGGIYRRQTELFGSGGNLAVMPLPLSIFLIFPLILLLHSFRGVKKFAVFTFIVFSLMMCSTVVSSPQDAVAMKDKLLLAMQYLLPFFGLILAEHVSSSKLFLERMARVFLFVVLAIATAQLAVVFFYGAVRLRPYLYFFSIYNSSQYSAIIFVSAFLLGLFHLYPVAGRNLRKMLLVSCVMMSLYAALSWSMAAILLISFGLILFWCVTRFTRSAGVALLASLLVFIAVWGGLKYYGADISLMKRGEYPTISDLDGRKRAMASGTHPQDNVLTVSNQEHLPQNIVDRVQIWKFYLKGIADADIRTRLFGHSGMPDRGLYPSAHNYYLDMLYNFGMMTLLPVFLLVCYTIYLIWVNRTVIAGSPHLSGLVFVVLFLVIVENSSKVGLRQPYPGVYTFFVWGVLLSSLRSAHNSIGGVK